MRWGNGFNTSLIAIFVLGGGDDSGVSDSAFGGDGGDVSDSTSDGDVD